MVRPTVGADVLEASLEGLSKRCEAAVAGHCVAFQSGDHAEAVGEAPGVKLDRPLPVWQHVRLAALAARYGHRIPVRTVLRAFMAGCLWNPFSRDAQTAEVRPPLRCLSADVSSGPPPDLPPTMTGLTLIEGGAKDMLPAESAVHR